MMIGLIASATETGITAGGVLGTAVAVVCSWERNRSVFWAIVAGILTWLYVIYFVFTRSESQIPKKWSRDQSKK